MKSIKLMLLIAAMLLPLNIHAQKPQDAYRQTIELLINKGQQKEQIQMQIAQLLQQQDQNNPQMAKMQKYFTSDDFLNDIIDMYEEALRPRLTLEQLQEVANFVTSDSSKLLEEKAQVLAMQMQDQTSPTFAVMMDLVQRMVAHAQGNDAQPTVDLTVDPEYAKLFHEYYVASGTDKIMQSTMQNMIGAIAGQFAGQFNADEQAQFEQMVSRMTTYMVENLEPSVMKMMEGIYTPSELNYYVRNMLTPSYQAYVDATANIDFSKFITILFEKMK